MEIWDDDNERSLSAPARPLTDIEEFRRSNDFTTLEQTVLSQQELITKGTEKYDFDSVEG